MSPQLPLSLDSSIVSCLLRPGRNPQVVRRYESSVEEGTRFILCPLVYYEVRRGLLKLAAERQLGRFDGLCRRWQWSDFVPADWETAAQLWVGLERRGRQIGDADLLIAVHALRRQATLVTDNEAHFAGLGVSILNWRTQPAE